MIEYMPLVNFAFITEIIRSTTEIIQCICLCYEEGNFQSSRHPTHTIFRTVKSTEVCLLSVGYTIFPSWFTASNALPSECLCYLKSIRLNVKGERESVSCRWWSTAAHIPCASINYHCLFAYTSADVCCVCLCVMWECVLKLLRWLENIFVMNISSCIITIPHTQIHAKRTSIKRITQNSRRMEKQHVRL